MLRCTRLISFAHSQDLFAQDAKTPTLVNVKAKSYRHVALYEPGEWKIVLKYNGGSETVAKWTVLPISEKRLAKNVVMFIGDGAFLYPGLHHYALLTSPN